jgi:hypothetical protein
MRDHEDLIERFKPGLRYDSQEAFFADSAAMMTDGAGSTLRQGTETLYGGRSEPALRLDVLRAGTYGEGAAVEPSDRVALPSGHYRRDYARLRTSRPDLRNRIYGRAARGSDGRLWLQYWFGYVYNDYVLAARFGLHEGDWEMISLRIDESAAHPDLAVYAQHAYAEQRDWDDVVKDDDRPDTPLVFVARGSHGSYFEPGLYLTEVFYDIADGDRETPDLALEVIGDDGPPWALWPGIWGATEPRWAPESPSPPAPVRHEQWADPANMLALAAARPSGARRVQARDPGAALDARRFGRRLLVDYQATAAPEGSEPVAVVVTLNSRDEKDVAPRTFSFDVTDRHSAHLVVAQATLDPDKHYDVQMSIVDAAGRPTRSRRVVLAPEKPPLRADLLGEIRLALQWVRDRVSALFRRPARPQA